MQEARLGRAAFPRVWKSFLQQTDGREETCKGPAPQSGAGLFGDGHVVRNTKQRNCGIRKAHAEVGGGAQTGRETYSAGGREQLPALRALSDFCEGRQR